MERTREKKERKIRFGNVGWRGRLVRILLCIDEIGIWKRNVGMGLKTLCIDGLRKKSGHGLRI